MFLNHELEMETPISTCSAQLLAALTHRQCAISGLTRRATEPMCAQMPALPGSKS
ncbi:hypothetical protein NBRC103581_00799 [Gluconobacter wancherniae NBRC 103581]|nr:hypothetical protein NBRC103581_00799 [Gluconobacter wancherniae NBRC 103581]